MLGREEYPVVDEDSFESLFSLAGNQLRTNLRISQAEKTALTEFMDTPLLKILDQDGLVSIGEYFILLDFSEKVAAVTKEPSKVQLLKTRKYNDTSIQLYSFEDELLTILFGNFQGSSKLNEFQNGLPNSNMRIQSCSSGTPRPGLSLSFRPETTNLNPTVDREADWVRDEVIGSRQYRIRAKHAYQAAAIYFRLKSELEHYSRVNDATSVFNPLKDPFASISYWGSFTPNNRSTITLDACHTECQGCTPQPANTDKVQKIHHESGRRLTQVNLNMIFRGRIGGSEAGINAIPFEFRLIPISR